VTNWRGQIHERLEYTPYGELWIDWKGSEAPQDGTPFRFTGKELDAETGLYYYGARYLDPKTSRWLSADPAMGEYVPSAPVNDEARKRNGNLPGMGGVFNVVNLHTYHYAGNNPVKYVDPDGREKRSLDNGEWETVNRVRNETVQYINTMINDINLNIQSGGRHYISPDLIESAQKWLGVDLGNPYAARTLVNDLIKIRDNLVSKGREDFMINERMRNAYAEVVNKRGSIIDLHSSFFKEAHNVSGALHAHSVTKHGILFHETTHFRSVLNTRDREKTTGGAIYLVKYEQSKVRTNSYNWEFFFVDYARKR
jgi:RHS repeat-associated protein